jgi:hypothetical protein
MALWGGPRFVSCRQILLFEKLSAAAQVQQSGRFLSQELSARLAVLRRLASAFPPSCQQLPSVQSWGTTLAMHADQHNVSVLTTQPDPRVQQLAGTAVDDIGDLLERCAADLQVHIAKQLQEPVEIATAQQQTDRFFSRGYFLLHGLRTMTVLHNHALNALDEGGTTDTLVAPCDVTNLVHLAAADARAFAREKFGKWPGLAAPRTLFDWRCLTLAVLLSVANGCPWQAWWQTSP